MFIPIPVFTRDVGSAYHPVDDVEADNRVDKFIGANGTGPA